MASTIRSDEQAVEVIDVWKKRRGRPLLQSLRLAIPRGATVLLTGDNGAGKSTLLDIIAGYTRADRGIVRVFGKPAGLAALRAGIVGVMTQRGVFPSDATPLRYLVHLARLQGLPRPREEASRVLELAGLRDHARCPVSLLSSGMSQRAALAQAFLGSPELFLLDEPFSGLDATGVSLLRELLVAHRKRGASCLLTCHSNLPLECDMTTEIGTPDSMGPEAGLGVAQGPDHAANELEMCHGK